MKTLFAACLISLSFLPHAKALNLSLTESELRAQILKITPLGTSKEETEILIKKTIKLKNFEFTTATISTPKKWPLGRTDITRRIMCRLGEVDRWPLPFLAVTYTEVDAHWGFDASNILVDVWVWKHATGL